MGYLKRVLVGIIGGVVFFLFVVAGNHFLPRPYNGLGLIVGIIAWIAISASYYGGWWSRDAKKNRP